MAGLLCRLDFHRDDLDKWHHAVSGWDPHGEIGGL